MFNVTQVDAVNQDQLLIVKSHECGLVQSIQNHEELAVDHVQGYLSDTGVTLSFKYLFLSFESNICVILVCHTRSEYAQSITVELCH